MAIPWNELAFYYTVAYCFLHSLVKTKIRFIERLYVRIYKVAIYQISVKKYLRTTI